MKLTIHGYKHKLENKYYNWYCSIIEKRIQIPLQYGEYCESHHILPRSLGGNNDKDNLVNLSAREHYLVHWLLCKFITGHGKYKMLTAFLCMHTFISENTKKRYVNSRAFEKLKIYYSKSFSDIMKKRFANDDYKKSHSNKIKKTWHDGTRDEQREYMKNNSPLKNKEIHAKTIRNREKNGNNIWVTNNPMKNPKKAKEIASKRSGKNHYLVKNRKWYYKRKNDIEWIEVDTSESTLDEALKKLNFSRSTFMKMIHNDYRPKTGTLADIEVKRVIL